MRTLPAALALLLLAACGRPPVRVAPERWIEEDPSEIFRPAAVLEAEQVVVWGFADRTDLSGWRFGQDDSWLAIGRGGLLLAGGRSATTFSRRLQLPAAGIDAVEVEVSGTRWGDLRLLWRPAGEGTKWSVLARPQAVHRRWQAGTNLYRFRVAGHPEWRGTIARLGLLVRHPPKGLRIRSVRALRLTPDANRLSAIVARAFKVELDGELRNARLGVPGLPVEWRATAPRKARLTFGFGVPAAIPGPVRFRLLGARPGGEPRPLFESEVGGGAGRPAGRWHEAEVDLGELAGGPVRLVFETFAERRPSPLDGFPAWGDPEIVASPRGRPPVSVLLVSIDTLRADRLSLYGNPRPTSPHLDRWAAESAVTFRQAVAQAPWTLPSHVSMLTGLDAFRHGVNFNGVVPNDVELLAEVLRRAGFSTRAITGGGYLDAGHGFARGFDRYRAWRRDPWADDEMERGVELARDWLRQLAGRPFFLFFHTYAVHAPYRARQPFFDELAGGVAPPPGPIIYRDKGRERAEEGFVPPPRELVARTAAGGPLQPIALEPGRLATVSAAYDSGVAYADAQLGRLLNELKRLGLAERTLVVVTSDHGESLGEEGVVGHGNLREDNLLVPLVVGLPGGRGAGRVVERQVRSVDLLPTVLDAVGLEPPADLDGVSLLPLVDEAQGAVPRHAFSYASHTNQGIAMRVDGRFTYLFNDTAWMPPHGDEELRWLRPPLTASAPGTDIARLRERVRRTLATGAHSLRLRIINAEDTPLTGLILGSVVQASSVKAERLAGPRVGWREAGVAEFHVPPGERVTLRFGRGAPRFTLEAQLRGLGQEGELTAEIDASRRGRVIAWDGRRWGAGGGAEPATGFRVWWVGRPPGEAPPPVEHDPALERQLRALGYLQ